MDELAALLETATQIAWQAGEVLMRGRRQARTEVLTKTSSTDMVTETDRASEALIVAAIGAARPDDGIRGEEGTDTPGTSGVTWVVDPLDGTTNFLYGFPSFSVSIAAVRDGASLLGVVHDPVHAETWTAIVGRGAACNGAAVSVNAPATLGQALVGTGFSYLAERRAHQAAVLSWVITEVRDIRRAGSAAIDLCWVAAGRLDAYYERGLQPWDGAAGGLVAGEAGARVVVGTGRGYPADLTVACAPSVAEEFFALIDAAHQDAGQSA